MAKFIAKKLLTMILTILAVSFLSFLAFSLISGNPATAMLGTQATAERVAQLEEQLGLNKPIIVQYGIWLRDFLSGNMGISYSYHTSVEGIILGKLPATLFLTLLSFLMIVVISFPLGLTMAMHLGGKRDRILQIISQIFMSIPPFFLGMIMTLFFGLTLRLFVPGGYVSPSQNFAGFLGYLICPALSIALPRSAMAGRFLRNSLVTEMHQDYVRTAYSRGNDSRTIFYRHMLRNALIPVITFLAVAIPEIVAGSIIVEQVFGIPGLGRILLASISNRDYPVVQAILVLLTFLVTLMNFITDVLYHQLDRRVDTV